MKPRLVVSAAMEARRHCAERRYRRLLRRARWRRFAVAVALGFLLFSFSMWALAGFFSELVGAYR